MENPKFDRRQSLPVWLLTTRGRPELCLKAVQAAYDLAVRPFYLEVYVDEVDEGYEPVKEFLKQEGGLYHVEPKGGGLAHSMRWCFERHPEAAQYGWLADDTFPRTKGWNSTLESRAGSFLFTYADDLWLTKSSIDAVMTGKVFTSGLCWGGDLVRAAGSFELHPEVKQAGIDDAWSWILRQVGLFRFCPDVVIEHWNYRTKKRPKDSTDEWSREDIGDYCARDCHLFGEWKKDGRGETVVEAIREMFGGEHEELADRLERLYADYNYNPSGASARFAGVQRKNATIAKKVREEAEKIIDSYREKGIKPFSSPQTDPWEVSFQKMRDSRPKIHRQRIST